MNAYEDELYKLHTAAGGHCIANIVNEDTGEVVLEAGQMLTVDVGKRLMSLGLLDVAISATIVVSQIDSPEERAFWEKVDLDYDTMIDNQLTDTP